MNALEVPCSDEPDECVICGGNASLCDTQELWRVERGNLVCSEDCFAEYRDWWTCNTIWNQTNERDNNG